MAGILAVASVVIFVLFGATILSVILTVVYPSIQSIKAIESKGEDDDKEWLTYWTIFGVFSLLDEFGGIILSFVPFYYYIRLGIFFFLMAPQTKGALSIYKYVVGPILKQHKDKIEAFINEIKGSASDISAAAKDQAASKLSELNKPENLLKAAQYAQ